MNDTLVTALLDEADRLLPMEFKDATLLTLLCDSYTEFAEAVAIDQLSGKELETVRYLIDAFGHMNKALLYLLEHIEGDAPIGSSGY